MPTAAPVLSANHATQVAHRRTAEAYEASALALFRTPSAARRHLAIAAEHRSKLTL